MTDQSEKSRTESGHLTPQMLADLLSGEIEPDDLRTRVVPHLLAHCRVCRRRVEEIRKLQARFDHWNESVVLREGEDAPRLLASLMALPDEARIRGWFLDHGHAFDAALVSLDLAVLYLEQKRDDELRELAAEVFPMFVHLGVGREAMAAFLLLHQAVERKSASAEMVREIRELLRRRAGRRRPLRIR